MKILSIDKYPICEFPFLNAGRKPGGFYVDKIPIHVGIVDKLPSNCDAIVVTADLQGRECFPKKQKKLLPQNGLRLLGEVLPDFIADEVLYGLELNPVRTGVFLAGDFYTVPGLDKRGGSGDVTAVWRAFGDRFKWVMGVAGNHDMFHEKKVGRAPRFSGNLKYLDGERATIDGLNVAGIGGIIGNPKRLHRRWQDEYIAELDLILFEQTDVLVMHDGPNAPSKKYRGSDLIREVIEKRKPDIVLRGHSHWPEPMVELQSGVQVLNVDARAVILRENPN